MAHQVLEEYNSLPTTQTTDRVPQNICYGEAGVTDFGKTRYGEVTNLLQTCYGETGAMDFGLYHITTTTTKQHSPPRAAWNCDLLLDAADSAGPWLQTHPLEFPLPLSLKPKEARLSFLQR